MNKLTIFLSAMLFLTHSTYAQDKGRKLIGFNNITELTVGFQIGKSTKITSFDGGQHEVTVAGRKFPSPRLASAFGVSVADILFVGPGLAYAFQASDNTNAQEHQVSVFAQSRLNFARGRIRPYADFKGGYHFASFKQANQALNPDWYKWDGFFLEPALGISFKLGGHALLNTSLGYQFINAGNRIEQSIEDENGNALLNAALHEKYHQFLLSFGFTFF